MLSTQQTDQQIQLKVQKNLTKKSQVCCCKFRVDKHLLLQAKIN